MRRNTIVTNPSSVFAGSIGCWKFLCSPSVNWPKGTIVYFELESDGRDIDWQIPQTDPDKKNAIFALIDSEQLIKAKQSKETNKFEFHIENGLQQMHRFQIVIGGKKDNLETNSGTNQVQKYSQRKKTFLMNIEFPNGQKEQEKINIDVRGNKLSNIKVLAPSYVSKGKRFDITIRFEDEFGNLTNNAHPNTLIGLSYENLRDNLNWKLFVHEAGFVNIPNLYFNDGNVYRIKLRDLHSGKEFSSPPIKCFIKEPENMFWGMLRGESYRFTMAKNAESTLRFFRDEMTLNFYAAPIFNTKLGSEGSNIRSLTQTVEEFNEEDRFVTFQSFHVFGENKSEGTRLVILAKENKNIKNVEKFSFSDLKKICKSSSSKDFISIPILSMADPVGFNFSSHHEQERLVEIYSSLGSCECEDNNSFPIKSEGKHSIKSFAPGSIRNALNNNIRFGFCAGGLNQVAVVSKSMSQGSQKYYPGLTAVLTKNHNRDSIFEALWSRSCYATTGEKILIDMTVCEVMMGKETNITDKPGLTINRHICGFASGTSEIISVEIIRNGEILKSFDGNGSNDLTFEFDDSEDLESICLKDKKSGSLFSYYYMRAKQKDGHMAWSSPTWIDLSEKKQENDNTAKKKSTTSKAQNKLKNNIS